MGSTPLCLQILLIDLGLAQGVLQHQRVDFRQPLALPDLVAHLDLERLQLPGNLGTDIHLADTFEQTGRQYRVRPWRPGTAVARRAR